MADWIDYRMETFSRQVADDPRLGRLRPIDHSVLMRLVEELMREAWNEGRRELSPLWQRIEKGRTKYANGCTVLSLIDEAGEVAHAVNKYENEERVRDELLDVAAVAMRLYFGEIDRGLEMDGLVQRRAAAKTSTLADIFDRRSDAAAPEDSASAAWEEAARLARGEECLRLQGGHDPCPAIVRDSEGIAVDHDDSACKRSM